MRGGRPAVAERERARAHAVLDRLLDLLCSHAPSSGSLRLHYDRQARLHVEARDIAADTDALLTMRQEKSNI
jgi:hypothetical protein